MNKQRRSILSKVIGELQNALSQLETIQEEESEAFDNMPEGLQSSSKGSQIEENIDVLEAAVSNIEDVIDSLSELI